MSCSTDADRRRSRMQVREDTDVPFTTPKEVSSATRSHLHRVGLGAFSPDREQSQVSLCQ